jgi:hypothetical protein
MPVLASSWYDSFMEIVLKIITSTAFVWLPVILFFVFRNFYLEYKKQSYKFNKLDFSNYVFLEVNLPKEIYKSPQAMEMIIDVLHHMGGGGMDWKHQYWYGALLFPSSLEIVSIEGNIYFFIRAHKKIAALVKSTIYSQFPQAEVNEVDDYTKYVPNYNNHQDAWKIYGADFKLSGPNFLPIKTYVDYQLDEQIGKREEFQKIDPLTPMIEFLSTLGPGEQVWIQYVIRADAMSSWRKEAIAFVEEKMNAKKSVDEGAPVQMLRLSYGEQEQIKAVQRSLGKLAFETIIRAVYLAKKENENPNVIGYFKNPVFKPFSSMYFNGIKKNSDVGFDWIWEDFSGKKDKEMKEDFFNDYVNREGFYRPNKFWDIIFPKPESPKSVLTSEELATLFHFPGTVSETSSLDRIEATKSEAPQDLPI